jgi:hypothetical protein
MAQKRVLIVISVQSGQTRDPEWPRFQPSANSWIDTKPPDISRRVAQVILAGNEYGRPMAAPPGVPADRVKILREAYARALKDPQLVAEAKQVQIGN